MNKDEVLFKAQAEGAEEIDEGSRHIRDKAARMGQLAFAAVYLVIVTLYMIRGQALDPGVSAMFCASLTGETFAQWRGTGKAVYLVLTVLVAAATVLELAVVVTRLFGAGA